MAPDIGSFIRAHVAFNIKYGLCGRSIWTVVAENMHYACLAAHSPLMWPLPLKKVFRKFLSDADSDCSTLLASFCNFITTTPLSAVLEAIPSSSRLESFLHLFSFEHASRRNSFVDCDEDTDEGEIKIKKNRAVVSFLWAKILLLFAISENLLLIFVEKVFL